MRIFFHSAAVRRKKKRRKATRRFRLHFSENAVKGESPAPASAGRKKPDGAGDKGFNLTELATAAAVMTVISVVGISSYKTQKNKAAAMDAKRYLTTVYSAEKQFYATWKKYHENLSLVGAIPFGMVTYDVGFGKGVSIDQLSATDIPTSTAIAAYVTAPQCATWDQICEGHCSSMATAVLAAGYFSCTVNFKKKAEYTIYDGTTALSMATDYDAEMTAGKFKAVARGYLSDEDVWSINEDQEIKHEKDGTK